VLDRMTGSPGCRSATLPWRLPGACGASASTPERGCKIVARGRAKRHPGSPAPLVTDPAGVAEANDRNATRLPDSRAQPQPSRNADLRRLR